MSKVKGLLFDSGRVLNVPATGDWYQSPKFFQIIGKSNFDSIAKVKRQAAFNKAKDYFNSIIISSELGVTKPSEQMYKEGLKELSLNEDEVIFVDDNPKNCDGAAKLGIRTIILDRSFISRFYSKYILKSQHKIVKNLYELEKLI